MQAPVAAEAGAALSAASLFRQPQAAADRRARRDLVAGGDRHRRRLWDYTLGHQVTEPYDFTHAIRIAAREFAPDLFIITGPGTTLGGAVAQSLILSDWRGMASKADFQTLQQTDPLLISMGMDDQRSIRHLRRLNL